MRCTQLYREMGRRSKRRGHSSRFGSWTDEEFFAWLQGMAERAIGTEKEQSVKEVFQEIGIFSIWQAVERRRDEETK